MFTSLFALIWTVCMFISIVTALFCRQHRWTTLCLGMSWIRNQDCDLSTHPQPPYSKRHWQQFSCTIQPDFDIHAPIPHPWCLDLLCESRCMHAIITNHNIDIIIRETHSMSSSEAHYVHSVLSHDLPLQSRPTLPFGFMSPIGTSTPTFHGLIHQHLPSMV